VKLVLTWHQVMLRWCTLVYFCGGTCCCQRCFAVSCHTANCLILRIWPASSVEVSECQRCSHQSEEIDRKHISVRCFGLTDENIISTSSLRSLRYRCNALQHLCSSNRRLTKTAALCNRSISGYLLHGPSRTSDSNHHQ
jgi:Zn ribbon nucleic-acid-binding protein